MEEELHQLEVGLLSNSNSQPQILSLQQQMSYLTKKLTRGTKHLNQLEIKINNNALDDENE